VIGICNDHFVGKILPSLAVKLSTRVLLFTHSLVGHACRDAANMVPTDHAHVQDVASIVGTAWKSLSEESTWSLRV